MKHTYILLALVVVWAEAGVVPKDLNKRDTSDKIMAEKLSKIRDLLQELRDGKNEEKPEAPVVDRGTTPPAYLEELKEPMVDVGEVHGREIDSKPEPLTRSDVQALKELKRILEKTRRQKADKVVSSNNNDDLNDLADDRSDSGEIMWRDLARELQSERDQLYIQNKEKDANHKKVKAVITEGEFLPLKDETSVEKNLMTDLALAFHSGITVDDIVEDLTRRAKSTD